MSAVVGLLDLNGKAIIFSNLCMLEKALRKEWKVFNQKKIILSAQVASAHLEGCAEHGGTEVFTINLFVEDKALLEKVRNFKKRMNR